VILGFLRTIICSTFHPPHDDVSYRDFKFPGTKDSKRLHG
jgi:hypothetical protein